MKRAAIEFMMPNDSAAYFSSAVLFIMALTGSNVPK